MRRHRIVISWIIAVMMALVFIPTGSFAITSTPAAQPAADKTAAAQSPSEQIPADPKHVESVQAAPEKGVKRATAPLLKAQGSASVPDPKKIDGIFMDNASCRAVFCEARNGIYFINKDGQQWRVSFYDLSTDKMTEVISVEGSYLSYADDRAIYLVKQIYDSSSSFIMRITEVDLASGQINDRDAGPVMMENWAQYYFRAFGVDGKGRIYLAGLHSEGNKLCIYKPNGETISETPYSGAINDFYGFDSANGNFYYRGSYNWRYWGYNHDMSALMAGNVDSAGTVTLPEKNLMILYQNGWYSHKYPVQFLNGQYLAALSCFLSDSMVVLDSHAYDVNDYTESETVIEASSGNVRVSLLNIASKEAVGKLQCKTAESNYVDYLDHSSEGPRCALLGDGRSLLVKTQPKTLTEYNLASGKERFQAETVYEVYDFAAFGNKCVALERDGDDFYVETIDWTDPTDFTVTAPSSMQVEQTDRLVCGT